MVKIKQDLLNSIKEFTLMDDPFMTKVFEDDIERTQLILRIILENDTIKVKKASTQKRLKNLQGRDLQLDILAEKLMAPSSMSKYRMKAVVPYPKEHAII